MKLAIDPTITYAVALEGGGARGSYEIGVWKALREAGIRYDAVAGTSVGALNGALMAQGDLDKAISCWENIRLDQVMALSDEEKEKIGPLLRGELRLGERRSPLEIQQSFKRIWGILKNGGLDIAPLREWIAQMVDPGQLKESPVDLYVTTVNLTDRIAEEIHIQEVPAENICNMLMASAYHPTFRQEKLGGKNYADGGFFDTIPLHVLVENGHKNIIAVRMPSIGIERRFRLPQDVSVTVIDGSKSDLGTVLNFDAAQAKRDLKIGYYDAKRVLYGLKGSRYYIEQTMSEREALEALLAMPGAEETGSLAEYLERILPAKARKKGLTEQNYHTYLIMQLEEAAEKRGIDPYQILTDRGLLDEIGPEACETSSSSL